eukprot:6184040-Pleurochrysis_carterae.AAC.3
MQPPSRRGAPCRLRPSFPRLPLSPRSSPSAKGGGGWGEHCARLHARCLRHRARASARVLGYVPRRT